MLSQYGKKHTCYGIHTTVKFTVCAKKVVMHVLSLLKGLKTFVQTNELTQGMKQQFHCDEVSNFFLLSLVCFM